MNEASGVTESERYLGRLCRRSFLSLWSYAGIYRDQYGGKEIVDLLVLFGNDVVLFSDKEGRFGNSGDLLCDWRRWYRNCIRTSAAQLFGAERWLREHPDRVFLDRKCTLKFPLPLPDPCKLRFHRIIVAHGASAECRRRIGGSGSFVTTSEKSSDDSPFVVGQPDPDRGFIHVLDDVSLNIVLAELGTITDFISYLDKKERLVKHCDVVMSAGEEELLAIYLRETNADGFHDFIIPSGATAVFAEEGHWADYEKSLARRRRIEADKISYFWDELIEKLNTHVYNGTQYYSNAATLEQHEKIVHLMAREPRVRRRALTSVLLSFVHQCPLDKRGTRVVTSSFPGDPYYVFLAVPETPTMPYDKYREARRTLLTYYCRMVRLRYEDARDVVGIATEAGFSPASRSEDIVYYDARQWSETEKREIQEIGLRLGLLTNCKVSHWATKEYPGPSDGNKVGRNSKCPCGSGKRYQRCCGSSPKGNKKRKN